MNLIIHSLVNIDLLSVGIAVAAIGLLGFIVFFNNKKSITNRTFLFFALIAVCWNTANYVSSQSLPTPFALWALRSVVFFAVWYSFALFQLFYVFPKETFQFSKIYKILLLPAAFFTSLLTLTPLVFSEILSFTVDGKIERVANGLGINIFGITVLTFIGSGLFLLLRKIRRAPLAQKIPYRFILVGTTITFALHIIFNFIFPAFLDNARYIPLGAVFTFPFVGFTAYAIIRHRLLDIKSIATGVLTFTLATVTLLDVLFSREIGTLIFRISVFTLVLSFGILLIRSVRKEIEQREELEELTYKLERANVELKRLDKAKSEFVSIASHQLRTPLTAIKGYLSLLMEGSYGKITKKAQKPMENMYESNERLIHLVNDLLNLSCLESGKLDLELQRVDLKETAQSVINELQIKAKQRGLNLSLDAHNGLPLVLADKEKIRNVILNLIDNAIRYTPTGGIKVRIEDKNMRIDDGEVLISVRDTGAGMEKEELERLFDSFTRGRAGEKLSTEGSGLGLYIAKQFVKMHHGKIWAESPGRDQGSTFFVKLSVNPDSLSSTKREND